MHRLCFVPDLVQAIMHGRPAGVTYLHSINFQQVSTEKCNNYLVLSML